MSSGKATPVQRKLNGEHVQIELLRLIRRKMSELLFVKRVQLVWLRQDYGMVTGCLIRLQFLGQLTQPAGRERLCDFSFFFLKKNICCLTVSN